MPTKETRAGPTPNGGVSSEIVYLDSRDNVVDKEEATQVWIRELDAQGELVYETFGIIQRE